MRSVARLITLVTAALVSAGVLAYVPMLDETDGPSGNSPYYLIFPAWENTLPGATKRAYFIVPKYLAITGTVDPAGPTSQFGVQHRGFTLLPNGDADWPPSVRVLATVELYKNDPEIKKLQDALIKRDTAAGLQSPDFPPLVFSKFSATANIGGVSNRMEGLQTTISSTTGGAPGQPLVIDFIVPSTLQTAYVFDLPATAGRNSALWGVTLRGSFPGYANRLKCTIFMDHKKVYQHFKARAAGQAYWGLAKVDIATEMQKMDQDQSINFGACRGSADQIDKIVIPVWTKIADMADQEGNKMFQAMVQKSAGIPGHPEASDVGWGFQFSSGFESVDYHDSTTINFDISFSTEREMFFAMTFPTVCNSWKQYFINGTDPSKACVTANDYQNTKNVSMACYATKKKFIDSTYGPVGSDYWKKAMDRLGIMGCAYDGGFGPAAYGGLRSSQPVAAIEKQMGCRANLFGLVRDSLRRGLISAAEMQQLAASIDTLGCSWRAGGSILDARLDGAEVKAFSDAVVRPSPSVEAMRQP